MMFASICLKQECKMAMLNLGSLLKNSIKFDMFYYSMEFDYVLTINKTRLDPPISVGLVSINVD